MHPTLNEVESMTGFSQFVTDFIWYLSNLLLVKTTDDINDIIIDMSTANLMPFKAELQSPERGCS